MDLRSIQAYLSGICGFKVWYRAGESPFELVEKLEVPFFERRSAYREHHLEGFKSILIALFTLVMSKNCLFCPCFREEKTEYVEIHWGFARS